MMLNVEPIVSPCLSQSVPPRFIIDSVCVLHLYGLAKYVGASHADLNHIDDAAGDALHTGCQSTVGRHIQAKCVYALIIFHVCDVSFAILSPELHIIFKIIYWRAGTQLSIRAYASSSANVD